MFYQIPPVRFILCLKYLLPCICSHVFIEISIMVLKQVLDDLCLLRIYSLCEEDLMCAC